MGRSGYRKRQYYFVLPYYVITNISKFNGTVRNMVFLDAKYRPRGFVKSLFRTFIFLAQDFVWVIIILYSDIQ